MLCFRYMCMHAIVCGSQKLNLPLDVFILKEIYSPCSGFFFPFVFKWLESYKRNSEVLFLLTLLHKSSLNLQVKKKKSFMLLCDG